MTSFNFNGVDSASFPWLLVNRITGSLLPSLKRRYITVPGREGAYHAGRDVDIKVERIKITVLADSQEELAEKKRILAEWLDTEQTAPFFYSYEPDKVYQAVLSGETDLEKIVTDGETELIFEMPDPYATSTDTRTALLQGAAVREYYDDFNAAGTMTDLVADASGLRLAKEGVNVSGASDDWTAGTHYRTNGLSTGVLLLEKGADISRLWTSDTDWLGGTLTGRLSVSGGNLRLNTETWNIADSMDNFRGTGWTAAGDAVISQQADHVLINATSPVSQQTRIYRTHGMSFSSATFDFKASITGDYMKAWITNGGNAWRVFLPNTNGVVRWFRIRIINTSTAELYVDGALTPTTIEYTTSTSSNIQFYIQNAGEASVMRVYRVYFATSDKGAPPEGGMYSGMWVSEAFDISAAKIVSSNSINLSASYSGENIDDSDLFVEANLIIDGVEQGWEGVDVDLTVPGLEKGANVENTAVRFRITLQTRDPGAITYVSGLSLSITGGYYPNGYFESDPIDISQVGKAAATSITWTPQQGVKVLTRVSLDGGNTWSEWGEAEPGAIPGITPTTDLSNARFQYRVELETTDVAISPSFNGISYALTAAYKPTGQWVSPPISLAGANIVGDSSIFWTWNGQQSIQVEARLNGGTWQSVTNNGEIPGARGTQGAALELRVTLSTADPGATPEMNSLEVVAREETETTVTYNGTAPGKPTLKIDVTEAVTEIRVTHLESGQFILLQDSFQAGDQIIVDHADESITWNGVYRLNLMNIKSRFFKLSKGANSFLVSPEFGVMITMEWAERWK